MHNEALSGGPPETEFEDQLDPANQSLAEALRKSFRILKLLMLVLVVLYFLSGWFRVEPSDHGVILRFGWIVGAGSGEKTASAVLDPGWYWSWPYPFERWETVSSNEREIPIEFLFHAALREKRTQTHKSDVEPSPEIHAEASGAIRMTSPTAFDRRSHCSRSFSSWVRPALVRR